MPTPAPRGTLVTDLATGRPLVRRFHLVVTEGAGLGLEVPVDDVTVIVGSHPEVDLRLDDPMISRHHFEACATARGLELKDLGSRNGTQVNDRRIESAVLGPGDFVIVGGHKLEVRALDTPFDAGPGAEQFGALSSRSAAMRAMFAVLERVAATDASLLIEGETGSGKDVLARTLHAESHRREAPFLVLDCGAVSRELIASELFGHKKGAFTGAQADRVGLFEAAQGGTVFLDELGELPLELQPSLLRVLESRTITRVGETAPRDVDVRVIAATNRSLGQEVSGGRFREDLYYRLAVVHVTVPPLRDRPEDVLDLAGMFLAEHGRDQSAILPEDRRFLLGYGWPGNVRELKNVVERSALLSGPDRFMVARPDGSLSGKNPAALRASPVALRRAPTGAGAIDVSDLLEVDDYKAARQEALARFERVFLEHGLQLTAGNVSALAERVGLARAYVHRLLTRHGIDRRAARDAEEASSS